MKEVSTDFQTALNELKNSLKAAGEMEDRPPWGNDDIGSSFGALYEGFREGMMESMTHLIGRVDDIGGGLKGMGNNHEVNEDFNDSLVKSEQARAEREGISQLPSIGGGAYVKQV